MHSLPYALSFASCFTASKLFGVLISLHICSSMPMVHVYYLSKATHTLMVQQSCVLVGYCDVANWRHW